ncbi:cytochrome P450 [Lentinula aciculospora]|uniref:Cytochrome P450 n=1 Tax=Lentinula aciculospora TaxID=153920 RepID=A0A9W9AG95_9AGAR|nr:cytochrome P450 [Lentinula aciculospora]
MMHSSSPTIPPFILNPLNGLDLGKTQTMVLLGVGALVLLTFRLLLNLKNNRQLPPGPRGLPVLGNALQLASASQIWLLFDKWKSLYGPITYLNLAGQHVIVLNTKAAATELLDRRSAIYSDRPKSIVGEYVGTELTLPFIRYHKRWQRMRRAAQAVLNVRASARYQPVQIDEAAIFARNLLHDTSSSLFSQINRSASTMISVIYGKRLLETSKKSEQSPEVLQAISSKAGITLGALSDPLQALLTSVHAFTTAVCPGANLVEFLPILDYLPSVITTWKRKAKQEYQTNANLYEGLYNFTVSSNQQQPNLCVSLAENELASDLTEVEKAWAAGAISAASLDTTSVTIAYFLYAMSLHPEVQERAQRELDEVVGRSRTPSFDDMLQLPYVRAIIKEVLRWQPVTPLALPHASMEDDWYEGYFIPKGTTVLPNVWSMNREEDTYGYDVDQFRPERFMQESENRERLVLRPEFENNDGHSTYGFGRRVCIGRHVADNGLFITMSTILWTLHIKPKAITNKSPRETHGADLDVLNLSPDFDCSFSPRFPEAEGVLQLLLDNAVDHDAGVSKIVQ